MLSRVAFRLSRARDSVVTCPQAWRPRGVAPLAIAVEIRDFPLGHRAQYRVATDDEALAAFRDLARTEGIVPALEPAHALARARDLDAELILVGLSGRGDKDLAEALPRVFPVQSPE